MNEEKTVLVLKVKGLDSEQVEKEFSTFFNSLVKKYPNQFTVNVSTLKRGQELEKGILSLVGLAHD